MAVYTVTFEYTSTKEGYESGTYAQTDTSGASTNIVDFVQNTIGASDLLTAIITYDGSSSGYSNGNLKECFKNCSNLTSVTINNNITGLPQFNGFGSNDLYGICYGCTNLKTFTWNDTTGLPLQWAYNMDYTFYNCQKLETCILPKMSCSTGSGSVKTMQYMFYNCNELTTINCDSWETYCYGDTNLQYAFYNCYKLVNIPTIHLRKSTYSSAGTPRWYLGMYYTFYNCRALASCPVHPYGMNNCWTMAYCFYNCYALTSFDFYGFSHVSNSGGLAGTFYGCENLTQVYLGSSSYPAIRSANTNLNYMFYNCKKLTWSGLSNIANCVLTNVTNFNYMFGNCNKIHIEDFLNAFSSVTFNANATWQGTFKSCLFGTTTNNTTTFDISDYSNFPWVRYISTNGANSMGNGSSFGAYVEDSEDTVFVLKDTNSIVANASVTNYGNLFAYNSYERIELDFANNAVTSISSMFYSCTHMISYDIHNLYNCVLANFSYLFGYCTALKTIILPGFNCSAGTTLSCLFYMCTTLTSADLSNFDTTNVTNMSSMFYGCYKIQHLDLTNFDTTNVTIISSMFYNCQDLIELDLSHFNTINVTNFNSLFAGCYDLQRIITSRDFITAIGAQSYNMFNNCTSLVGGNGTQYDSTVVDATRAVIDEVGVTGYFTGKNYFNKHYVEDIYFNGDQITELRYVNT